MHRNTAPSSGDSGEGPRGSSCPHLQAYKDSGGLKHFRVLQMYIQQYRARGHVPSPECKLPPPHCIPCNRLVHESIAGGGSSAFKTSFRRLHACLHCVFMGCWDCGHVLDHLRSKGHSLAIDVELDQVFCSQCNDYIYDRDLDDVIVHQRRRASMGVMSVGDEATRVKLEKAPNLPKAVPYVQWIPKEEDRDAIDLNGKHIEMTEFTGLRGLFNMGNTCFMNCVLQALLHLPPFRNFFLADLHSRATCPRRKAMERGSGAANASETICIGCEIDYLFSQVYSEKANETPFAPFHFLYSVWKLSDSLAGYAQQDAHEFLITVLNALHSHCTSLVDGRGTSMVHTIFGGKLRSEITCTECSTSSTAVDPIFDLSLQIPLEQTTHTGIKSDPSLLEPVTSAKVDLYDCLRRYTSPEVLKSEEKCWCAHCKAHKDTIKRLSIARLPLVLIVHLKRFKHGSGEVEKINKHVMFPFEIDFGEFTSAVISSESMLKSRDECNGHSKKKKRVHEKYDLFAVVSHFGSLDTGHYISYVRQSHQWYKCDDQWVSRVSKDEIMAQQAYILFYIRRKFAYAGDA